MADIVRVVAIGGTIGALIAGSLAAPAFLQKAFASEPAKVASVFTDILPRQPYDPSGLLKLDVVLGPGVSTDVQRSAIVSKISYGHREYVSIITTPSGTYSSDALTSANVKYPGIDVVPRFEGNWFNPFRFGGKWTSSTSGSITTLSFVPANSTQS
jgi:hypothetical protein